TRASCNRDMVGNASKALPYHPLGAAALLRFHAVRRLAPHAQSPSVTPGVEHAIRALSSRRRDAAPAWPANEQPQGANVMRDGQTPGWHALPMATICTVHKSRSLTFVENWLSTVVS